ncbi:methylenetetrahydrofolate reductase (NADPH) isoform X2 [Prorops nasuta]|uniref:methylenetetrahydrofolate reductase (NADPH) isoform X2 n=1 Tax=Prorops nasuta TaxID=863751 RepID=UPI0034CF5091
MRIFVLNSEANHEDAEDAEDTTYAIKPISLLPNQLQPTNIGQLIDIKITKHEIFYSFELIPVKNQERTYLKFFRETKKFAPLFYALTWHSTLTNDECLPLETVKSFPQNTLLHLAARNLKRNDIEKILAVAVRYGKINIFALQGDASSSAVGDFPYALDLVKFIKFYYGSTFSICVAGYPDMHPNSVSKRSDLLHLKAKIDAGADYIITQIIFESQTFINFVKDCREIGIKVPILPGIFPINNYKSLIKMTKICKLKIPSKILSKLEPLKANDQAVRNFGINLAVNLIKSILNNGAAYGFHFFTLNRNAKPTKVRANKKHRK